MSQENVEIVRRADEGFDRGRLDLSLVEWDEQGEWLPAMADAIEAEVYRGHFGIRRYFEDLFERFSDIRVDEREYRDLGDRVLALFRLRVRGDSGLVLDRPGAILYELRNGKIIRGRSFLSHEEALEAAGLLEQDAHADS